MSDRERAREMLTLLWGECDYDQAETAIASALAQARAEGAQEAEATLEAWFDLSEKAEEAGADILKAAVNAWLNRACSGGMSSKDAELVRNVLDDAARLYLWQALVPVLRTMIDGARAEWLRQAAEVALAEKLTGVPPPNWDASDLAIAEGTVRATAKSIAARIRALIKEPGHDPR